MAQVRIRKRGKTYSYIFEAGKVDGKRKVVEKGGYATKAEAYKAGVAAYNDYLHGNIGITSESITLKDFMTNWLNNVVALNVKASTLQEYRNRLSCRIVPYLGSVKKNTLSAIHAFIHHAPDYAVYPAQLISSNPAAYIKVPRISEVLGLSWQDIDFDAGEINLSRQIRYLSKRGYFFSTLKTESSNRYIIANAFLVSELRRWQSLLSVKRSHWFAFVFTR